MEVELNPKGFEATYLECINTCFPGWGDTRAYDWAFGRAVSAPPPDLMVLRDSGNLLAGSAVTYRTMQVPSGRSSLVGIMTGSWTLPAARKMGCFSRVIEISKDLVRAKGGSLLLGFAKGMNPSIGRLSAAGSVLFPARYVQSTDTTPRIADAAECRVLGRGDAVVAEAFSLFERNRGDGVRFAYGSPAEWAEQFLGRRPTTYIAEVEGAGWCAVEEDGDVDRIAATCTPSDAARESLLGAMLARAQSRGRKFFFYDAVPNRGDVIAGRLALDPVHGHFLVMVCDRERASELAGAPVTTGADLENLPSFAERAFQSGDRM